MLYDFAFLGKSGSVNLQFDLSIFLMYIRCTNILNVFSQLSDIFQVFKKLTRTSYNPQDEKHKFRIYIILLSF